MEENITIEFVKEWIDKHNFSKGSFDRIMRDLIYNSGHNQIDNPYLRDWLIKNTQKFQDLLPVELNENQQAILSWLIDCYKDDGDPVEAISDLYDETMPSDWKSCLLAAYEMLNVRQKFQVLAAFADWGMKEVAE